MAVISAVSPALSGAAIVLTSAAAGGDTFSNPQGTALLQVVNANSAAMNVTLAAQQTARPANGVWPAMTLGNNVVTVSAGKTKIIGPITKAYNNNAGSVAITYSDADLVTVGVIQP